MPTAAAAHLGAGLVQFEHLGQVAPAYQHFLDALDLDPDADTAARARAALSQIAALQKYNIGRRRLTTPGSTSTRGCRPSLLLFEARRDLDVRRAGRRLRPRAARSCSS